MTGESTAERSDPPAAGEPLSPPSLFEADTRRIAEDRASAAATETTPARISDASNPFRRMEQLLAEIRAHLDASAREGRVRQFSLSRLAAALLQALVVGLIVWALSDWVFAVPSAELWVKLGFAAVFELGVIAALLASRDSD